MFGLGAPELIIIGIIVLFIFGAKRLPEIGKGLGSAIREFRKVKQDISRNGEKEAVGEKRKRKSPLKINWPKRQLKRFRS